MGKIDIEKFICDLLSLSRYGLESICFNDLKTGLQRQGLVYKDGEIVEIEKEKPLTQEEKDYIDKMVKNGSTARMEDLVYADKIKPKSIKFNEDTNFKAKVDKIVEFLKNDPDEQALQAEIHSWFEEKKPVFEMITPEESLGIDSDTWNKIVDECIYGEQKPAEWSKEDERMLGKCIDAASGYYSPEDKQSMKDWLKSLKDRVQPQPKQEWSEEDERIKDNCISFLGFNKENSPQAECIDECINWLKSLKDRYTWKPSEEQMDAIDYVKNFDYGGYKDMLVSLYYDLKKLSEE